MLRPLLDALDVIHAERCYRHIAPDNILILQSGRPCCWTGAARRVIGDFTQALTVILKPGFAPVRAVRGPEMRQGPGPDIYALAAVVYYCIGGKTPTPSVSRMMRDTLVPARELGKGRYSESFLAAIDHALAVHIEERIASVSQLRTELGQEEIVEKTSRTRLGPGPAALSASPRATEAASGPSIQHPDADEMTARRGLPKDFGAPIAPPSAPPAPCRRHTGDAPVPASRPAPMPAPLAAPFRRRRHRPAGHFSDVTPAGAAMRPAAPGQPASVGQGPRPPPAASPGRSGSRRPPPNGLVVTAIAAVLVLGAGGAWLMMGGSPTPAPVRPDCGRPTSMPRPRASATPPAAPASPARLRRRAGGAGARGARRRPCGRRRQSRRFRPRPWLNLCTNCVIRPGQSRSSCAAIPCASIETTCSSRSPAHAPATCT
jgi:hypothetical protein